MSRDLNSNTRATQMSQMPFDEVIKAYDSKRAKTDQKYLYAWITMLMSSVTGKKSGPIKDEFTKAIKSKDSAAEMLDQIVHDYRAGRTTQRETIYRAAAHFFNFALTGESQKMDRLLDGYDQVTQIAETVNNQFALMASAFEVIAGLIIAHDSNDPKSAEATLGMILATIQSTTAQVNAISPNANTGTTDDNATTKSSTVIHFGTESLDATSRS